MARPVGRVVIFGATSAVAQALGRRLAAAGAGLYLVARHAERLEAVAADLALRGGRVVGRAVADLDDLAGHAALLDQAWRALGGVDLVVVAQGVLPDQAACERDPALAAAALHANFTAPALLAQAAALRLAAAGSGGTVVAISSVAGDRGRQSNYVYGAAKGGLSTFLSGLRNRVFRDGVAVVTVKPGFIDSPMTAHLPKNALYASPDAVAGLILAGAARGRDVVYAPSFWRLVMLVIRHLPEAAFKRLRL
jgi:short-subunit dehydrogenase